MSLPSACFPIILSITCPSIHRSLALSFLHLRTRHRLFCPSIHSPISFLLSIYPFLSPFHSSPFPKCRQTSLLPPAAPVTHPATHPPLLPLPLPHSSLPRSLSPPYPSPRDRLFLFKSFPGWVGNRISFFLDAFPGFAAAAGQARGSGRGLRGRCPRVGAGLSRSRLVPALPPHRPLPLLPPDPVGETLFKDGKSQAWGSLSPGVQKGKSTAAPSPGQAPLPSAGTEQGHSHSLLETLSRPLPGTAEPRSLRLGASRRLFPRGRRPSPTVGSSRPWHQRDAGNSFPRAPQQGECRVLTPVSQELRDIRREGAASHPASGVG